MVQLGKVKNINSMPETLAQPDQAIPPYLAGQLAVTDGVAAHNEHNQPPFDPNQVLQYPSAQSATELSATYQAGVDKYLADRAALAREVGSTPEMQISPAHEQYHHEVVDAAVPSFASGHDNHDYKVLGVAIEIGGDIVEAVEPYMLEPSQYVPAQAAGVRAEDSMPAPVVPSQPTGFRARFRRNNEPVSVVEAASVSLLNSKDESETQLAPSPSAEIVEQPKQTKMQILEAAQQTLDRDANREDLHARDHLQTIINTLLDVEKPNGLVMMGNQERAVVRQLMDSATKLTKDRFNQVYTGKEDDIRDVNAALTALLLCVAISDSLSFEITAREDIEDHYWPSQVEEELKQVTYDKVVTKTSDKDYVTEMLEDSPGKLSRISILRLKATAERCDTLGIDNVAARYCYYMKRPLHETPLYEICAPIYGKDMLEWGKAPNLIDELKPVLGGKEFATFAIAAMEGPRYTDFSAQEARYDEVEDMMLAKLNLPQELHDNLKVSLALRQNEDYTLVHADKLAKLLETCQDPERCAALFHSFGIVNFDRYSESQLDTMYKLTQGDPAVGQQLQGTKVTLGVIDALADHNGAMDSKPRQIAEAFGDDNVLFAEASSPMGYYRSLLTLNRLGIKPSSLVITAHGMPGSFSLGSGLVNDSDIALSNIAKLVEQTMQPDVNEEKHIVFLSCSLAKAPEWNKQSVVEQVAGMTGAVTWGVERPTYTTTTDGDGPRQLYYGEAPAQQFRRQDGQIVQTEHETIAHDPNKVREG